MRRCDDVTSSLEQPASRFNQRVVLKFLRIRPKVLGVLEILIGIMMCFLTMWTGFFYLLWSSVTPVLTGAITASAARTHNMCQIRTSQFLNLFTAVTAAISIPIHYVDTNGVKIIVFEVCDILIFIFSVIVSSSFCECCRTKSKHVVVRYINTAVPVTVNNFVVADQQYVPPPNYDPGTFAPPPNYSGAPFPPPPNDSTVPSAPPPDYEAGPSAPSLYYCQASTAPPPKYDPDPSAPPPYY